MNLLLDTHTFLWALFAPEKLSRRATEKIKSSYNNVSISVLTFWEVTLKYGLGKLELKGVGPEELPYYANQLDLGVLSISPAEAATFHRLPRLSHKDPFDRFIIWQAIQRKMTLVSKDRAFKAYREFGLNTYW